MIAMPTTLSRYLARNFLVNFLVLMGLLLGVVYIFEIIELLRRSVNHDDVTLQQVLAMGALKLPSTGEVLLPFGVLFGSIYTCWKLNRTHELIVIRAAGLSVWQFLTPLIVCGLLTGVAATTIVNPLSSLMQAKYRQLENLRFRKTDSLVTISTTGIWLRQPVDKGYALLHAAGIDQTRWRMSDMTAFLFDEADNFQKRFDSTETFLRDGHWELRNVRVDDKGGTRQEAVVELPTELTFEKIEDSFADSDAISFWNIPEYIKIMEETGFPTIRLRIHFQSLLAQPVLFAAMVLLAATFSLRPPRFGGTGIMIALGVGAGFLIFFMDSVLGAFGASQKIPAYLAAWTPATISLLLGLTALLHTEDG
jgi:lipopolysaccharide export system permease protein